MRSRDFKQFPFRFGKGDVKNLFAPAQTFQEKLQRKGSFPGARVPVNQVKAIARQSARENIVQSFDSSRAKVATISPVDGISLATFANGFAFHGFGITCS